MRLLGIFRELVRQDVFPRDWLMMRMVANNSILVAMQFLAQTLNECFLVGTQFDVQVGYDV